MKENNNNKTWNERIAEYVMSGQSGPGIREQLESVESNIYDPRKYTKEDIDNALKGMYETAKEHYNNARKREAHLFGTPLGGALLGTYEEFMAQFNKNNPEWQSQKKNSTTND
jgi:hypothetical protein